MKRLVFIMGLMLSLSPLVFSQAIGIFDGQASIGDDNGQGSAKFSNGTYDIVASGSDLWGNADGCYYVYKSVTGPFVITAEVNWENSGPRDGDAWKKAGFSARDGDNPADDPSSPHATGIIIRSQGSNLEHRMEYNNRSDDIEVQEKRPDETNVIQLMRVGNTFTMLRGLKDGTFHVIGSTEVPMPDKIWVGLVVTSHNVSTTELAHFTNVSLNPLSVGVDVNRTIPVYSVEGGASVAGISLGVVVETGKTTDVTVTEKVPAGFTASNVKASIGTYNIGANSVITWTIPGAKGADAKLTYDVAAPKTSVGVLSFSGSSTVGANVVSTGGDWELTVVPPKSNGFGIFSKSEDIFDTETVAGDAGYDPNTGTYVVIGTGSDIWGTADNFHFLYLQVSGKVTLKANCQLYVGQGDTEWIKLGLMVRDDPDPASAYGFALIRTFSPRDFGPQWRDGLGSSAASDDTLLVPSGTVEGRQNGTIEITRDGTKIGFYYYDAGTGKRVESLVQELSEMADPIYVGLAVTSHSAGNKSTGVFTNVVLTVNDKPVAVENWSLY